MPSFQWSSDEATTVLASAVLPTPPEPTMLTNALVPTSARSAWSSLSRPNNLGGGARAGGYMAPAAASDAAAS